MREREDSIFLEHSAISTQPSAEERCEKNICFRRVRLSRCTTSQLKRGTGSATLWQHSGVKLRSLKISSWQLAASQSNCLYHRGHEGTQRRAQPYANQPLIAE